MILKQPNKYQIQDDNIDDLIEGLDSLDIQPEFNAGDVLNNGERTGVVLTKLDKNFEVVFEDYKDILKLNSN